jgi:hypothetical protein
MDTIGLMAARILLAALYLFTMLSLFDHPERQE